MAMDGHGTACCRYHRRWGLRLGSGVTVSNFLMSHHFQLLISRL